MTNRELKKFFYDYCRWYTYTPSIFEDEIWEYLMSTVGKYVGSDIEWNKVCDVANNVYKGDITKMKIEMYQISKELITLINTSLEKNVYPNTEPFDKIVDAENGRYLVFDMRNAMLQSLIYYNIISEDECDKIFSKYQNGEELKKYKWIKKLAFFKSNLPEMVERHSFVKQLFIDTINSEDPIFSQFKELPRKYYICGDRIYVPIYEKDIEKYQNILYKDYIATNGVSFFVDICEKRTIRRGDITVDIIDGTNSGKIFFDQIQPCKLNYDFYPQVYKKITKQSLEKYDLAYGYDDDVNFFNKPIWKN